MRDRIIWAITFAYALLFTILGTLRYDVHRNFVDFGIFEQTASSAFGCFCNGIEGSHWAFHFSPILYAVGAFVFLWHSPVALIALGACACALVIPPVASLIAARTDRTTARWGAAIIAVYPPLAGLAFGDFHENVFAPAAVAWLLWAFINRRYGLAALFAAIALAVKEDQAVFLGVAALAGIVVYRGDAARRNFCAGVLLVSCVVLAAFFWWIQPHATALPTWQPTRFYAWTAQDVAALPKGLLDRASFVVLALAPLAFLPFRSRWSLLALPAFAEVLLSRMPSTFTPGSHYAGAWMGYLLVGFAFGMPVLHVRRWIIAAVAIAIVNLAVANPMHPGLNLRPIEDRDIALDQTLARLPTDISLATQEEAYTHIALDNPYARLLPDDPTTPMDACFILIDRDFSESPRLKEYGYAVDAMVIENIYAEVDTTGGTSFFRREGPCR